MSSKLHLAISDQYRAMRALALQCSSDLSESVSNATASLNSELHVQKMLVSSELRRLVRPQSAGSHNLTIMDLQSAFSLPDVSRSARLKASLLACFTRTFCTEEVLGKVSGVSLSDFQRFAAPYLQLSALEGLSYLACDPNDNVVAFLFVEDVAGPSEETLRTGLAEKVEEATCPELAKVFGALASLQGMFKEKVGGECPRGTYFHILAAGAIKAVRSTGIVFAMTIKMYLRLERMGYKGVVTEATGFASQAMLKKVSIPELGFLIEKPYSDFVDERGNPLFPSTQTPSVILGFQRFPSDEATRAFLDATFYAGIFAAKVARVLPLAMKLRLYALYSAAGGTNKLKNVSRLHIVERAKYRALRTLLSESKSVAEMREEFVSIIVKYFPNGLRQEMEVISEIKLSDVKMELIKEQLVRDEACLELKSVEVDGDSDDDDEEDDEEGEEVGDGDDSVPQELAPSSGVKSALWSRVMGNIRAAGRTAASSASPAPPAPSAPSVDKSMWVPNRFASKCQRCKVVAFGVLKRRHHCRRCGLVVCGACSKHRDALPENYMAVGKHRVCTACHDASEREFSAKEAVMAQLRRNTVVKD